MKPNSKVRRRRALQSAARGSGVLRGPCRGVRARQKRLTRAAEWPRQAGVGKEKPPFPKFSHRTNDEDEIRPRPPFTSWNWWIMVDYASCRSPFYAPEVRAVVCSPANNTKTTGITMIPRDGKRRLRRASTEAPNLPLS